MVFYQLDDGYHAELRVVQAGTAAFGLYARCGCWMADNVVDNVADGVVPLEIATLYGTREWIEKLIVTGLWRPVDGGFLDVDYLARHKNRTKEQVRADRAKKAARDKRYYAASKGGRSTTPDSDRRVERRDGKPSNDATNDTANDGAPSPPTPNGVGMVGPGGPASAADAAASGARSPADAGAAAPAGPPGPTIQDQPPAPPSTRSDLRELLRRNSEAFYQGQPFNPPADLD